MADEASKVQVPMTCDCCKNIQIVHLKIVKAKRTIQILGIPLSLPVFNPRDDTIRATYCPKVGLITDLLAYRKCAYHDCLNEENNKKPG
jgi:hypothetical protein